MGPHRPTTEPFGEKINRCGKRPEVSGEGSAILIVLLTVCCILSYFAFQGCTWTTTKSTALARLIL